jgi:hypothetical protein
MKDGLRLGVLAACLMAGGAVHADVIDWLGWEVRPDTTGLKPVYLGVGLTNALLHFNAEVPTAYGNVYAKVGQFYDGKEVAGQIGWRYPYLLTGTDQNGYYLGGMLGHIQNDRLDGDRYNRLGGALELSYVWSNVHRINAASVAIGAGVEKTGDSGEKKRAKPTILFSYTFGVGAF